MIALWPLPDHPYMCDQCHQPGIGTPNQTTHPHEPRKSQKHALLNQRAIAKAKRKRKAKRASA